MIPPCLSDADRIQEQVDLFKTDFVKVKEKFGRLPDGFEWPHLRVYLPRMLHREDFGELVYRYFFGCDCLDRVWGPVLRRECSTAGNGNMLLVEILPLDATSWHIQMKSLKKLPELAHHTAQEAEKLHLDYF